MATNKNAMLRYKELDKCFQRYNSPYTIDELVEACNEALHKDNENCTVQKRQVYEDIKFMKSESGWNVPLETVQDGKFKRYRYEDRNFSINDQPLTKDEAKQLETAILTLSRFRGIPSNAWIEEMVSKLECKFELHGNRHNVIGFQQNENLKGIHFLSPLIDAITNQEVLQIQYHNYKDGGQDYTFILHPYYVKQYNNRWFLIGLDNKWESIINLALDRILSFKVTTEVNYIPTSLNFEKYFDNVVGVSIPRENPQVTLIKARFAASRFPYVTSKPIHASQRTVSEEDRTILFKVIPNFELDQLILSFGKDIEILFPDWYRQHIAEIVQEMYEKYNECR